MGEEQAGGPPFGVDSIVPLRRPPSRASTAKMAQELRYAGSMSRLRVRNYQQKIEARRTYAGRVFRLVCGWLAAVFALVVADG